MRLPRLLLVCLGLSVALTACGDGREPAGLRTPSTAPSAGATVGSTPTPVPTASTPVALPAAPPLQPQAAPAEVRLTGDGLYLPSGLLAFGTPYDRARGLLDAALGPPTRDSGTGSSFSEYGTCPGSQLRGLEYGGGALHVLFGDVDGPGLVLYQWGLVDGKGRPESVPRASALVGDLATFAFGVGTSVGELRAGTADGTLTVSPGDEAFPASFRLADQSAGFFGYLSGTQDGDTVTGVLGGEGCGE